MSATHLLFSLALLGAPADAPAEAPPEVHLAADAATPGTRILLRDVVVADHLERVPPELLDVDLGRAPSPGFGRLVTRESVAAALPPAALQLAGAPGVTVTLEVEVLEPERVIEAARRYLVECVRPPEGSAVEVASPPFEGRVPRGRTELTLRPRFRGAPAARGPLTVLTDVLVDGKLQLVVPTSFVVRTFAEVAVLARDVQRGERLAAADLRAVRLETTHMTATPPDEASLLVGRVARRPLRAGETLRTRDFELPVLVRRGEAVTLVFASGALQAEAFGIARDDGVEGGSVRVENLLTRKALVGRVVGPGLVSMNPGSPEQP